MNARNMARCALFAALLFVCAWLAVPAGSIFITMQTFGIFLCLLVLGGKWGSLSILLYLLLGAAGMPVFSGFRGGIGALLDASGGYLMGFLVMGILYWLVTALCGNTKKVRILALIAGLVACYGFGTGWYWQIYLHSGGSGSLGVVIISCVLPYILPDGIKMALAWFLARRLERAV